MLTHRQKDLLLFIQKRLHERGVAPSFDEMKDALSLRSKSGIHRLMDSLEERGFIKRLRNRARAVDILRLPDDSEEQAHGDKAVILIPFLGRIAAGDPREALVDPSETYPLSAHLAPKNPCYALRVKGDSMIDAGIFDGDVAIIERCDDAPNGAIVVALVDGEEATLKYLRRREKSIALEPANQDYETRIFGADQVTIQGKLTTLIRQYEEL